jgi:16S rRNA (cytosine967-C5)-methyltransferase
MSSSRSSVLPSDARALAVLALKAIETGGYANIVVDELLQRAEASDRDRRLMAELVYGTVRRQRTLDALIDQLATKPAQDQPPDLRILLRLGLYQLRYLSHIPPSAAVNTTVELAKQQRLGGLSKVVNGILRRYDRLAATEDPLQLPSDPIARLGVAQSYPDWIVNVYADQVGLAEAAQVCEWLNQPPTLDLRVNPLRATVAEVLDQFRATGLMAEPLDSMPQGLRLQGGGSVRSLPGFATGQWTVQDRSAQLVSHILDPQPGEVVIDACAAPGGKTTHIAELMGDRGMVWGCDRYPNRLKRITQTAQRLGLTSIQTCLGDSTQLTQFENQGDRVLVDAPCSGLGTLHRHADARWRQSPESVQDLVVLQQKLLQQAATWVKPGGWLVYSTCTLHPAENQGIVRWFLETHPHWQGVPGQTLAIACSHPAEPEETLGLTLWPHRHHTDGFFIAKLQRTAG